MPYTFSPDSTPVRRVLTALKYAPDGGLTIQQIADHLHLSYAHIQQIVKWLTPKHVERVRVRKEGWVPGSVAQLYRLAGETTTVPANPSQQPST